MRGEGCQGGKGSNTQGIASAIKLLRGGRTIRGKRPTKNMLPTIQNPKKEAVVHQSRHKNLRCGKEMDVLSVTQGKKSRITKSKVKNQREGKSNLHAMDHQRGELERGWDARGGRVMLDQHEKENSTMAGQRRKKKDRREGGERGDNWGQHQLGESQRRTVRGKTEKSPGHWDCTQERYRAKKWNSNHNLPKKRREGRDPSISRLPSRNLWKGKGLRNS